MGAYLASYTGQLLLAAFVGVNLLFTVWVWRRSPRESRDRLVLASLMILGISMLTGIVPRLLWPESERIHIGASTMSIVLTGVAMLSLLRVLTRRRGRPGE